jgi:hypothetical protein
MGTRAVRHLDYELDVIGRLGFEGYFLAVAPPALGHGEEVLPVSKLHAPALSSTITFSARYEQKQVLDKMSILGEGR